MSYMMKGRGKRRRRCKRQRKSWVTLTSVSAKSLSRGRTATKKSSLTAMKAVNGKGNEAGPRGTPTNELICVEQTKTNIIPVFRSSAADATAAPHGDFPRGVLCLMFQGIDILAFLLLKQHCSNEYSIGERVSMNAGMIVCDSRYQTSFHMAEELRLYGVSTGQ